MRVKIQFKTKIYSKYTVNRLYCYGTRKINIIHAQMRMLCSNLKAHLKSLHVIDDATCLCGIGIEDNFHFFFECPLYTLLRQELFASIRDLCPLTIESILYGCDDTDFNANTQIFNAVHNFIDKTQRFN